MKSHNNLLLHACNSVPFYRELGITIDLEAPFKENLSKFPILKRSDLCGNERMFISNNYKEQNLFYEYTSGSSGRSIKCYKSIEEKVKSGLILWKYRMLKGIEPSSKCVSFYTKRKNEEVHKINEGVLLYKNELFLNVLDLCDERLEIYLAEIIKFNPDWIIGPISALYYLAQFIKKKWGESFSIPSLKYIESAGEISSYEQRNDISKVFHVPLADMYGCREIWLIGFRETNGYFQTTNTNAFVELVPSMTKEQPNDIIITGLNAFAMPVIRYKVGDSGYYKGTDKKLFDISCARSNQYFIYKNRTIAVTTFFMAIFKLNQIHENTILKFQFIKKGKTEFDLLFIPDINYSKEHLQTIYNILLQTFDKDLKLNFIKTQYIEFSNNGKLSFFIDLS